MDSEIEKPDRLSALMSRFRTKVLIPNEIGIAPVCHGRHTNASLTLASFRCLNKKFLSTEGYNLKNVGDNDRFLVFTRCKGGAHQSSLADNFKLDAGNACLYLEGVDHIASALPSTIAVNLKEANELETICQTLCEEIHMHRCGYEVVVERLCEIVLVRLLRLAMETGITETGMLAGLCHSNIRTAVIAMHKTPEYKWTLEELAITAGMSRTRFANEFKRTVGQTPAKYLRIWRLTLAEIELEKGLPLKSVAKMVGFASDTSLSRAYSDHFGTTPIRRKLLKSESNLD